MTQNSQHSGWWTTPPDPNLRQPRRKSNQALLSKGYGSRCLSLLCVVYMMAATSKACTITAPSSESTTYLMGSGSTNVSPSYTVDSCTTPSFTIDPEDGVSKSWISIDSSTGVITIDMALDNSEHGNSYIFRVTATYDGPTTDNSYTLTVNLEDPCITATINAINLGG